MELLDKKSECDIYNPVSKQIWEDRYKKGNETVLENIKRVSKYISKTHGEDELFSRVMENKLFFLAGRTMSNAGIGTNLTLNNCFNSNHVKDSIPEIFERVKLGAITHKAGGGIGYDFSLIRPKNLPTSNDAIASGVISFMEVFNVQTATILQGGRRGANMSVLNIYHPEIYNYLNAKSFDEGKLIHFNLSIMIDDDFMKAKDNNEDIYLHYPVYNSKSEIIKDESQWLVKTKVNAKELWDLIMQKAYNTGEYGVFFYDNLNKDNNLWYMETIISTNPCGEYVSGTLFGDNPITKEPLVSDDYMGACNLGSLYLHNMIQNPFTKDAYFDFNTLDSVIKIAVRMLDNIIDVNKFPYYAYQNYQKNLRTIGLGFTGFADALTMLGMKYGDDDSIKFADILGNTIAKFAYKASIELAKEKGSFPFLVKHNYVQSRFIEKHIYFDEDWKNICHDIMKYGIRNARILSVAPVGTQSLTFGENCSSGIEPIFSLEYDRKIKIGGQDEANIQVIKMRDYAYDLWLKTPNKSVSKEVFVTAMELPVESHLKVLEKFAFHTDMSISKTINIPTSYLFEDTKKVYDYCWKNGIKGCTIFRPNEIRQGIFITEKAKEIKQEITELKRGEWKELAIDTTYYKRKIYIGCGKLNLFIGYSQKEKCIQDLYVVRSGSGGCERNLQGMVIAMSGMLRLGGNMLNIEKAFSGVGGCNSFISQRIQGQKLNRGNSCGTAILNDIKEFIKEIEGNIINPTIIKKTQPIPQELIEKIDICVEEDNYLKENGEIAFVKKYHKCPICKEEIGLSEGCFTCKGCGWSKCN